jgi:hypothetical protein
MANNDDRKQEGEEEEQVAEVNFDTAGTIANANDTIRELLQIMEDSYKHAQQVELQTTTTEFKKKYPQVVDKHEFYAHGKHSQEFLMVRDARCFFLVMQWNKGDNKNYCKTVWIMTSQNL